ncbi:flavin reductase family protein [Tengunoibacter tsumagoiensis]|uniref:Flavin reductase n=1 Tax=Tengunoibacter tsumagoiensis TaxID=2014871 RepID=A0A402A1J7_9CHLR|nr:flavin reductase family protein [Tengunoibacter tsumagoiensis]GCE12994.1 flavin reductase [Tengunoibacter tsumagoiensis]
MSVDTTEFRRALAQFASGVTVVTTILHGKDYGMTVSAFCSLSLQPPLILICIDQRASSHNFIIQSGLFGVNILSEENKDLSRHFSRQGLVDFSSIPHQKGPLGIPLLNGVLATLECRLVESQYGGDHSIFIGEVLSAEVISSNLPLVYFRGAYQSMKSVDEA